MWGVRMRVVARQAHPMPYVLVGGWLPCLNMRWHESGDPCPSGAGCTQAGCPNSLLHSLGGSPCLVCWQKLPPAGRSLGWISPLWCPAPPFFSLCSPLQSMGISLQPVMDVPSMLLNILIKELSNAQNDRGRQTHQGPRSLWLSSAMWPPVSVQASTWLHHSHQ